MLQRLLIQNYALIDNLNIELNTDLTIITGETGAGKSILLGALGLIVGQRADTQALMHKDKKCIVEGEFNFSALDQAPFISFFNDNELDYSVSTNVRREISPDGKSRAFINDTPVNLTQLKELGAMLIDIHSQHETLLLNSGSFQLNVVDAHAAHAELLNTYKVNYKQYTQLLSNLKSLIEQEQQAKADLDYNTFQLNELLEAQLESLNQEELEAELQTLTHSEEIKKALAQVTFLMNEGETNLLLQVNEVTASINNITRFYHRGEEFANRLKSTYLELKDISNEIAHAVEEVTFDPERIELLNTQLNRLYHLQQKHRLQSISELIELREQLDLKVQSANSIDEDIKKLESEKAQQESKLLALAQQISANRAQVVPVIEQSVHRLLADVGMPNASLRVVHEINQSNQFNVNGLDSIRFEFTANKGSEYKELSKVASGGELSRLMLCVKSLIAKLTALPTIIFDEIDTGISGEVAQRVGVVMQTIAKDRQVIAITHLPQMASKGRQHLFVYKQIENGRTFSHIRKLNQDERVVEIAKMLSGDNATQAAMDNAKELLLASSN